VTPSLTPQQLDRAAGALVGLAVGDALGAPYEFGPGTPDPQMIGGGGFRWEPGEWTDDTQMAICIAEVTATGSTDPLAIGERFLAWYRGHPKDVGVQTRSILSSAASAGDLVAAAADRFSRHPDSSAGNGSLMRTAAVALAHLGDDAAIAESAATISSLTHGDPVAAEACVLWCIAIDRAVRGGTTGIHDGLEMLSPDARDRWGGWLREAEQGDPKTFSNNGYVVTALQAAHWACSRPGPREEGAAACVFAQDAIRRVISLGGDTDTTAAIAGSLLGARFGASAFPQEWTSILHGWPGYDVRDLVRLAVLTADGGAKDRPSWPDIPSMVEVYRPQGLGPGPIRLNEDEEIWVGGFAALEEADRFDVIVSLCRVGRDDTPGDGTRVSPWLIDREGMNPNLDFLLADLAKQICSWRDQGKSVLIQCARAERRTPTVAAAYLAESNSLSGDQGWRLAKAKLPDAHVNSDFIAALDRVWG
jgi:ADP-ribosylglycohydrolase